MTIDGQNQTLPPSTQLWYKDAVFYELYVRAFRDSNGDGHGDLRGVIEKLDYLQELGITCLWLLPIYGSPLKDDGYDISDYYGLLPEYGTLDDFEELVEQAHQRGIRVIADLVLNHTSDQHPWFQAARSDPNSPYRDYYVWSDTDQRYRDARIIFIDDEVSNWTFDPVARQYFWHRFYSSQPDLNFDNPAVQEEMLRVVRFWMDLGIDGFRTDAVPYLYEREGTNCENLPETHAYLKRLRRFMDAHYPGKILLCEANQWPEDVCEYFGDGDEFHMGFHFPVMPRIYMALRRGERSPLEWIVNRTPLIPSECQWCTFLRNHDELTLEMVTPEERLWMWQEYAPEPRMRQNLGIRRRLAPLLDNDRRRIELANSLLFTLPGSPIVYYGDEIGMGDHIYLPDRNGLRTPMQWDAGSHAGFSRSEKLYSPLVDSEAFSPIRVNVAGQLGDPGSLWHTIRRMIAVRKTRRAFVWGDFSWAAVNNPAVAAYWREFEGNRLLAVHNLSESPQPVRIMGLDPSAEFDDLLGGATQAADEAGCLDVTLEPYRYLWLEQRQTPA